MSNQQDYDGKVKLYVDHLVGLWLCYIAHPSEQNLHTFKDAQSILYLTQVYGLQGNYSSGINLLALPNLTSFYGNPGIVY